MGQADEIVRYYDALKGRRTNHDNTAQEIIDHIDSHHLDVTSERAPGEKKNALQFDGTALYANQIFVDFYQSSVFNQATKWFSPRHPTPGKNAKPEVAAWLDRLGRFVLSQMRGYYGPAGQAIGGWSLFGNGALLIEEVPNRKDYQGRIKSTSIPYGKFVWAEGGDGMMAEFIHTLKLPAHRIYSRPGWADKVSDEIRKAATSEKMSERAKEFEILHSILPRDFQDYSKSAIKTNKDYEWASCWVEKDKKNLLAESGYRKFPVACARMHLISGDVWARGLGEIALADAKGLNMMKELALLKGARELDPPVLVRRGSVINSIINLAAKGKTVVADINNSIRVLNEGGNWPVFQHMQADDRTQVLRVFHVEEILNLLSHESPQLTAFEVNARLTLLQQILGPVFGQNDVSFFNPSIDIFIDLLANMVNDDGENLIIANCGEPPDDIVFGKDAIEIFYEGPLARAQRNQELVDLQQSIADIGGLQPFWPESVLLPSWETIARRLWEIRATQGYLRSADDFADKVKEMQRQAAQDKAAQGLAGAAQALGAAAPGIKVLREGVEGQVAA